MFPMNYDFSVFLLRLVSPNGVFVFPSNNESYPGLFTEKYVDNFSSKEVKKWLASYTKGLQNYDWIDYKGAMTPDFPDSNNGKGRLILMDIASPITTDFSSFKTLPEILRSLDKNKKRIPYIKAFQSFSGSAETEVNAVELDESLKKAIKERLMEDDT